VVGRPIAWLNDKSLDALEKSKLYHELVLRKCEVELEHKIKGPNPTKNNLAMQSYAKIYNRNKSKSDVMMAMPCLNEANIAHVAIYGDLCQHALCRGKRNSAKHLWSECRRSPNNNQNKIRSNITGPKYDRGVKNRFRTIPGGNNFPESNNNGSYNIINSGSKPDRFGGKQNYRSNSNYQGYDRKDGNSYEKSRGGNQYSKKLNNYSSRNVNSNQGSI
jgi:hypothetical protein